MKQGALLSIGALGIAAVLAACSGSRAQETPPPKEPVSTTRVTSQSITVTEPAPAAAPDATPPTVESAADRDLSAKIRQHLGRKPQLSKVDWSRVRIVTVDGNVTLSGELPTTADAIEVEHAVREVKGVKGVTNDIRMPRGSE